MRELIILPISLKYVPIIPVKLALAMNHIIPKLSNILLAITERKFTPPCLLIILKPAVIGHPGLLLLRLPKGLKPIPPLQYLRVLVIKPSLAMQLIIPPLPLIRYPAIWIVQGAMPIHLILVPVA